MSATWYVNGESLERYGFRPSPAPAGRRSGVATQQTGLPVPGMLGELDSGFAPVVPARIITVPGHIRGTTLADALDKARQVLALCGRGPVTLRCVDAADRSIVAVLDGERLVEGAFPALKATNPWVGMTLRFRAAEPAWRDTTPQLLAIGQARVPLPLGYSVPSDWTLEIFGSEAGTVVDPQVIYEDAAGNTVASLTLTDTLNWATDATARLRLSTEGVAPTVRRMTAGVWAAADASLTAGWFFALSPHDGWPAEGSYPTLRLFDAGARATGLLRFTRRHEL